MVTIEAVGSTTIIPKTGDANTEMPQKRLTFEALQRLLHPFYPGYVFSFTRKRELLIPFL